VSTFIFNLYPDISDCIWPASKIIIGVFFIWILSKQYEDNAT